MALLEDMVRVAAKSIQLSDIGDTRMFDNLSGTLDDALLVARQAGNPHQVWGVFKALAVWGFFNAMEAEKAEPPVPVFATLFGKTGEGLERGRLFDELLRGALLKGNGDPDKVWAAFQKDLHSFSQGVKAISTGISVLKGMDKGRLNRWGKSSARVSAVQDFFDKQRKSFPKLGVNGMINAAMKSCKVSRTFIQEHRRSGELYIPDCL